MALTIIFMLFFSIILVIRNYKNKYSLLFILMVFGMIISLYTIVSEIYRSSNYLVPSSYLYGSIEYKIFLTLNHLIKIPLSDLLIIRNSGIVIYLLAIMLFVVSFSKTVKSSNQSMKPIGNIIRYIALTTYPVLYFIFYHPNTAYRIYLYNYSIKDAGHQQLWFNFITSVDFIMSLLAFIYLVYPILFLIRNYLKNQITFFAEQLLGLAVSMGLLNTIFYLVFFTGVFKNSVNTVFHSAFWRYKRLVVVPTFYAVLLPVLSLCVLLIVIFIIVKFKTDNIINGLRERAIKKNLNLLNTNLKDVLHSNKNIMFNMKILAEEAIQGYGSPEGLEKLNKILSLSNNNMLSISKTLDNIRELKVSTINHNLTEVIETALRELSLPANIRLIKHYNLTSAYCDFDQYHMSQVITNLITNAVDAIKSKGNEDAQIDITVDASKDWIYLSVRDDGCGIPRKLIKKIFNPYFSTKSKQHNWGIGLSYVFRVINSHYGHIRIKSKPGEYTLVEILLPRTMQ